jgi:hypothetical protein
MHHPLRKTFYALLLGSLYLLAGQQTFAQVPQPGTDPNIPMPELGPNDTIPVPALIHEGQIVPGGYMEWVYVRVPYPKHLLKKRQEYNRLRNAVYVTYPYARKAGYIINQMNVRLAGMKTKGERRKYIKSREKELKKEFADPMQELSVYQGKVLMKLINRQTGNNCYEIIKEYKGGFNARFFQTVAFFYGGNLKQSYDATAADREIETIVTEVERIYGRR